jgi:hypothetical protein
VAYILFAWAQDIHPLDLKREQILRLTATGWYTARVRGLLIFALSVLWFVKRTVVVKMRGALLHLSVFST